MVKLIAPDYYKDFVCIADACRHSCCVGWEIGIDAETMEYYRSVPGEIGEKLRASTCETEEGACFRLTEEERCPFLTDGGLCELILRLGEGALCQICDDHPRFRNFFSDCTEIGLGLCCEAAGRLILGRTGKTRLITLEEDGGEEAPDEYEEEIRLCREQLTGVVQDRSLPLARRADRLREAAGLDAEMDFSFWADVLGGLERMDEAWNERLESLKRPAPALTGWEVPLEQLMVYLLYRHLPGAAEDGDLPGRTGYVYVMWRLLERMFRAARTQSMEELVGIARLYSSEIEYSDENVGAILDEIHRIMR